MKTDSKNSEKRRLFKRWFTRKAITYIVVCGFLTFVNFSTTPHLWWVQWVIAGWGLQLALTTAFYLTDCDETEDYKTK